MVIPHVDDRNYPVRLGPSSEHAVIRAPHISYERWGVDAPESVLRPVSRQQYTAEWEKGGPEQMEMVGEAAKAALGDCPGMLYETNRRIMLAAVNYWLQFTNQVNITELGYGKSTVGMYKHLMENNVDPDQVFVTGIEPSQKRVDDASEALREMGLEESKHFRTFTTTDRETLPYIDNQHVITDVATCHHDPYRDTSLELSKRALVPGGFRTRSDWFERMCMYPSLVLQFYQGLDAEEFGWDTKERDLQKFRETFPNTDYVPDLPPEAEMGVRMIQTFWGSWARVRQNKIQAGDFNPDDDYFLQEAHGYPGWDIDETVRAGLSVDSGDVDNLVYAAGLRNNPHRITTRRVMLDLGMDELYDNIPEEGSELLTSIIAQKRPE